MANLMNSPAPMEDQAKLLDEVLNVVRIQAHQMNNCLVRAKENMPRPMSGHLLFTNMSSPHIVGKQ
jgi:hypothetical protein